MTSNHTVACIRAACLVILLSFPVVLLWANGVTAQMRATFLAGIIFAIVCGLGVWLVYLDWTRKT